MYASEYAIESAPAVGRQENETATGEPLCDAAGVAGGGAAVDERSASLRESDVTLLALVELVLKDRTGLHRLLQAPATAAAMLPRLLAISLVGFALFGGAMSLVLTASGHWPSLTALATWIDEGGKAPLAIATIESQFGKLGPWLNGEAAALTSAYAFGLVAASGVCLPSLYFYCLLAGVKMSMRDVAAHAVKAKAVAAVALVGILPIYVAVAMGVIIFDGGGRLLTPTLLLGLVLPFIAGVWGTASLYQGFAQLCSAMPSARARRRECFLRRLVLSWSACYSAVMPVMIFVLWEALSRA
jgi:hypothetical protein